MGTNVPSMSEPLRLKYQLIWFSALPSQFSDGVTCSAHTQHQPRSRLRRALEGGRTPVAALSAPVIVASVYVLLLEGVMPAAASRSYVGSVLKSPTTVLKNATASAPLGLPLGRQLGLSVLRAGTGMRSGGRVRGRRGGGVPVACAVGAPFVLGAGGVSTRGSGC